MATLLTRANRTLRPYRAQLPRNKATRDMLHNLRLDIVLALREAEVKGQMVGSACMAAAIVHGHDEPSMACEALKQFGQSPDDWKDCDLTPYDMRAVRKAFKS